MIYDKALEYVNEIPGGHGDDPQYLKKVLDILQWKQRGKIIHIAGTNGKGSTGFFMDRLLQKKGKTTVHLSSPHLLDYRERFLYNGELIEEELFIEIVEKIRRKEKEFPRRPYYFEMALLIGLLLSQIKSPDYLLLETGIGGKEDATNFVGKTSLAVITTVAKDHENILGNSLEEIARHKAGIIKYKVPTISLRHTEEIDEIIMEKAKKEKSPLLFVDGKDWTITCGKDFTTIERDGKIWESSMCGSHQGTNLSLAVVAVESLEGEFTEKRTRIIGAFPGRMERLRKNPLFYIDGAHNEEGERAVLQSLSSMEYDRLYLIVGKMRDKTMDLHPLTDLAEKIILTKIQDERAEQFTEGEGAIVTKNPREAVEKALELATEKDLILALGSIYLIGEIKEIMENEY
ncbi:MAG: cyanophycin synthetase [Tissierellia bacterium]|nr:cyanophycin synthetase [Tissierellia bacterium]